MSTPQGKPNTNIMKTDTQIKVGGIYKNTNSPLNWGTEQYWLITRIEKDYTYGYTTRKFEGHQPVESDFLKVEIQCRSENMSFQS